MKNFSVTMALVDFIPVLLFGTAAIMLQRDFYNKMSKGAFALFAAGTIDIVCAGAAKALYKLLYAASICDMEPLNAMFFPVQSIGFLLAGMGVTAMVFTKQNETVVRCFSLPLFSGTYIFVSFMCLGLAMIYIGMEIIAVRLKKPLLIAVFVISFLCSLCMGYMSSKDFTQAYMNWIAQAVNILGQGLLLYGVIRLRKAGLTEL